MIRARLLFVVGATVILALRPSIAQAQLEKFVEAVREVGDATVQPEPSRSNRIRAAADRMGTALDEWDRNIRALEARAGRESSGATVQNQYRLHLELGVAYTVRGRIDEALRQLDAAAAIQPSSSDLQVLRALGLEAAGRHDEAGKAFRAAWNLDTRDPVKAYDASQRSGADRGGERDRAGTSLTETYQSLAINAVKPAAAPFLVLTAIPDNMSSAPVVADQTTRAGFALLGAGKYGDAIAALKRVGRAATTSDDSPLVHFQRGQAGEAQNRVADARREYQAALAGAIAGRSVLFVAIARLAQVDGDLTGAIDAFAEAVRLNPNDPNIHREFASAYAAAGRSDDAFAELMAALLINRRDADAHAAIGQLYLDTSRNAEAVVAFNRALDLMPGRYETRYALATAHARLGNQGEAARQLELFERARREALEKRRRDLGNEVDEQETVRRRLPNQGDGR